MVRGAIRTAIFLAIFVAFAQPARGQSTASGTLNGVVKDSTGLAVPGVTVTAVQTQTNLTRVAHTGTAGAWTITTLPVGEYTVTFELAAFKKLVRPNVVVEAGVPRSVSVTLEIGTVSESITVTGGVELLARRPATAFRRLSAEELRSAVPTTTRSFTHLLSSEAGVSADLPPVLVNGTGNISPSVNGTRTTSTSLFFNGIDATNLTSNEGSLSDNIAPAPETLEEVKLQTSLYDAATGRSGGGNFQLVTRSGTNLFDGTGYFNVQHEKMNANDFFFELDGIDKPKARRNEGGFTVGGPIRRNRVFFFGGYQRTQAETGFVPTASSITVLPAALRLIQGARTKESLLAAFSALNPSFSTSIPKAQCPSADRPRLHLGRRAGALQPAQPGDRRLTSFRRRARASPSIGNDTDAGRRVRGGNPLVRQRNVVPSRVPAGSVQRPRRRSAHARPAAVGDRRSTPTSRRSIRSPIRRAWRRRSRCGAPTEHDTSRCRDTMTARRTDDQRDPRRRLRAQQLAPARRSVPVADQRAASASRTRRTFFDSSDATTRLGHYIGRPGTIMERFSFGGPNDTFNRARAAHLHDRRHADLDDAAATPLRFGGEFRRNEFDTNLPEEQATEFEKFDNFTHDPARAGARRRHAVRRHRQAVPLPGLQRVRRRRLARCRNRLTLNLGIRYEFFGWPEELDGRIGNVDFDAITNTENPVNAFIVPNNVQLTGFAAIDEAINASRQGDNRHTLKGQDWNNVAPRLGFAWTADRRGRTVVRGGYGVFYDRPSSAFINTVFSNYPFLRESRSHGPEPRWCRSRPACSQQNPHLGFNHYLPNRVVRATGANGVYEIRDGTGVTRGADGIAQPRRSGDRPARSSATSPRRSSSARSRAISRRRGSSSSASACSGSSAANLMVEARYVGSRGHKLLESRAFNQGYDLNDPSTPDYIFERFNKAYVDAGAPNGALNAGATARERGLGRAFGFANSAIGGHARLQPQQRPTGAVIPFEARGADSRLQHSRGRAARQHRPLALPLAAAEPAEAAVERAAVQRVVHLLAVDGHELGRSRQHGRRRQAGRAERRLRGRRAISATSTRTTRSSDFDRPHRFSGSFVYELPLGGIARGVRVSGFVQLQSGLPYSIFSAEPESQHGASTPAFDWGRAASIARRSAGRACAARSIELRRRGRRSVGGRVQRMPCSAHRRRAAGGYPDNLGFGNLGRNVLRGLWQRRVDLSIVEGRSRSGRDQRRTAVGHLQPVQHRQLRAAEQRHRRRRHRLRPDHRHDRRANAWRRWGCE